MVLTALHGYQQTSFSLYLLSGRVSIELAETLDDGKANENRDEGFRR